MKFLVSLKNGIETLIAKLLFNLILFVLLFGSGSIFTLYLINKYSDTYCTTKDLPKEFLDRFLKF